MKALDQRESKSYETSPQSYYSEDYLQISRLFKKYSKPGTNTISKENMKKLVDEYNLERYEATNLSKIQTNCNLI